MGSQKRDKDGRFAEGPGQSAPQPPTAKDAWVEKAEEVHLAQQLGLQKPDSLQDTYRAFRLLGIQEPPIQLEDEGLDLITAQVNAEVEKAGLQAPPFVREDTDAAWRIVIFGEFMKHQTATGKPVTQETLPAVTEAALTQLPLGLMDYARNMDAYNTTAGQWEQEGAGNE